MDCFLCWVSSAEYSVHLVGVNNLSACREFCGVHSCKAIDKWVLVGAEAPSNFRRFYVNNLSQISYIANH